jgi:hypothetical protein
MQIFEDFAVILVALRVNLAVVNRLTDGAIRLMDVRTIGKAAIQ